VIANLLDVPEKDHQFFAEVFRNQDSSNLNQAERDVAVRSLIVLAKYFGPYVQDRRKAPRGDIVSELAIANYPDGSKPEETEIVRLATLLFAAGQDTTAKLLGNGVRYIVEEPGLQDRLRSDPSLLPDFVEEMLRIEGFSKVTAQSTATTLAPSWQADLVAIALQTSPPPMISAPP
jgi:cytochrome P450